jgi:L-alanine-DL-glutamate epimerase-like enolase superfamily enzyme
VRISAVRLTTCRIPLSRPIVMGDIRFEAREYLLVEIRTDAGIVGTGFGMTRDAPLAAILARAIAPRLLGADPLLGEAIWTGLYDANLTLGQRGLAMRCLSAVDIALWDIKAQVAGLPLWQVLGGARETAPAMVAGGYPRAGTTLDELAAEVAGYAAAGIELIKIAAGDLAADTERLRVSKDAAGPSRLAYDVHWAWKRLADVLPTVRGWADLELAFLEDPFPSESPRLAARLRDRTGIPLALGEDVTGRHAYRDLLEQAPPDHLRLDATTAGGISEAVKVCALAAADSIPVLPHIFPELHIHLAAALPIVAAVEVTDPDQEIDLFWRLLVEPLRPVRGVLTAPRTPGIGAAIDDAARRRYAVAEETIGA